MRRIRHQAYRLRAPSFKDHTPTSAPLPKFVIYRSTPRHELRKQRGTASDFILVPLVDLKFLNELAAGDAGTSNRRHSAANLQPFPIELNRCRSTSQSEMAVDS